MRCLSPSSRYSIQVFEGRESVVVDARGYASSHVLEKPVIADFTVSGLMEHEIDVALQNFSFSGLPEGVSPLAKISVFDTDAFCAQYPDETRDEMQAQIEQRLRDLQKQFGGFIIVDQPAAAKPWPSYDENSVEDVIKFQESTGIAPQVIRLYEEENLNREEIVSNMLRKDDPARAEELYGPALYGPADAPNTSGAVQVNGPAVAAEAEKEAFTVES